MAHQSRICTVLFDVDSESYESSARFWSGALGREMTFDPDERYTDLPGELDVIIQNANPGHEGVHIDIETDDVDAEVTRLEKLGARKRNKVSGWWVMIAPGNNPFCVVPVQSKTWPEGAIEWK